MKEIGIADKRKLFLDRFEQVQGSGEAFTKSNEYRAAIAVKIILKHLYWLRE